MHINKLDGNPAIVCAVQDGTVSYDGSRLSPSGISPTSHLSASSDHVSPLLFSFPAACTSWTTHSSVAGPVGEYRDTEIQFLIWLEDPLVTVYLKASDASQGFFF